MSRVYFFSNETKNEFVYASNVGTYSMEIETIVETICQKKKWEASDKVVIIPLNDSMISYCYQNKRFQIEYKDNPKFEWIEIETNEDEICNEESTGFDNDYDSDYNQYDEIEDDRYDEWYDYDEGYGYEDESFECCDMY
jgi:hypothetical protein